jgi:hypothetical protein
VKLCTALLCVAAVSGCSSDPEGFAFVELGVSAAKDGWAESEIACEALPVLQGSHRYTELVVDSALNITVFSSPDEASVRFEEDGRSIEQERVISRATLESDYAESVSLVLQSGASYVVTLASVC